MDLEFGKFKGRSISDPYVATDYLRWLRDKLAEDWIALSDELEKRKQVEGEDRSIVESIIEAGFSALTEKAQAENGEGNVGTGELRGAREALLDVVREYFWKHGPTAMSMRRDDRLERDRIERARQIMRDKKATKEQRQWAEKMLADDE